MESKLRIRPGRRLKLESLLALCLALSAATAFASQERVGPPAAPDAAGAAIESAKRDGASKEGIPYLQSIASRLSAQVGAAVENCGRSVGRNGLASFEMALRLDKQGNVEAVFVKPEGGFVLCAQGKMSSGRFPAPPFAPFYLYVNM